MRFRVRPMTPLPAPISIALSVGKPISVAEKSISSWSRELNQDTPAERTQSCIDSLGKALSSAAGTWAQLDPFCPTRALIEEG